MAGVIGESIFEVDSSIDVTEDDGFIIIAEDKIPDSWPHAEADIHSFRSLDRHFVFAGEQVRLLLCLPANKCNLGSTTPLESVAGQRSSRQNEKGVGDTNSVTHSKYENTDEQNDQNKETRKNTRSQNDSSTGDSFPGIDDHQKRQTNQFLQRFKDTYVFARIAESNEPLWSERSAQEACFKLMETSKENLTGDSSETSQILKNKNPTSVVIDRGELHSPTSGGAARGAAKFCTLSNGDIVVILQVKVGVEFMMDPVLEILQLEKCQERNTFPGTRQVQASFNHDPYGELLNWLLPVNNPRRSSGHPLSPKSSSIYSPSIRSSTPKRAVSVSSGIELFSFGHVRSYSMSSLQPNKVQPETVTKANARPSSAQEDQYQFSFKSFIDIGNSGNEKLLSFRGVPLVPERFSIQCGLEGLFTPGRRWRRKFDLIQPLEIHSFSVDCNTDDLICVCIKNVSPEYAPDVVVFIDSITMVFEEASSSGPPLSLPVTCTESGSNYSLPNLALRRGEEHSFILKPVTMFWRNSIAQVGSNFRKRRTSTRSAARSSWLSLSSANTELIYSDTPAVQYAVLVSCRCNYTESKLFFRHPVSWRPRNARDIVISIASNVSRHTVASDGTQLPVQALTLQASNMTLDDLTLTVMSPSLLTASPNQAESNAVSSSDLNCTHLSLQTRVPLGCVPSRSTVAVNLEVLPMTNGIITLDSLQIDVKEKGCAYAPKQALKFTAAQALPCYNARLF